MSGSVRSRKTLEALRAAPFGVQIRHGLRDLPCDCHMGLPWKKLPLLHENSEEATAGQLIHDQLLAFAIDDAMQSDDVGVAQTGHEASFHEEIFAGGGEFDGDIDIVAAVLQR